MTIRTFLARGGVALIVVYFAVLPGVLAELPFPADGLKAAASESRDANRRIKKGDKIQITIYPPDRFIVGGKMQISSEGNITLALVGKVYVEGLTLIEAERKLVEIIDADYIIDPEVVIELEDERKITMSISILGAVKTPGSFDVETSESAVTLIRAILKAGGFSAVANIKKIKIVRKTSDGGTEVIRVNAEKIVTGNAEDVSVLDGDIIHVAESLF